MEAKALQSQQFPVHMWWYFCVFVWFYDDGYGKGYE